MIHPDCMLLCGIATVGYARLRSRDVGREVTLDKSRLVY